MLNNEMAESSLDDNTGRKYNGESVSGILEDLSADNTDTGCIRK